MAKDYDKLASDLLDWAKKWTPWLKNRPEDHSLDDANKRLKDFRNYRLDEKPPRIEDKGDLENLHDKLQTRLKLNNRPKFQPENGKLIEVYYFFEVKINIYFRTSIMLGKSWSCQRRNLKNGC